MRYIAPPSVRSHANRHGVDLDTVAVVSGRQTVTIEDIDQYLRAKSPQRDHAPLTPSTRYWDVDHSEFGPVRAEPLSRVEKVAAQSLAAANAHIPQVTHHERADIRKVEAFRTSLKKEAQERGIKLTTLAFHIKALSACLGAFPKFNASLGSDQETLHLKSYIHIGIAVDTPAGLIVPVLRDQTKKACGRSPARSTSLRNALRRERCGRKNYAVRR